jgi:hypothetical protein
MRIIDKAVQLNENMKPVMLVTIELPLVLAEDNEYMEDVSDSFSRKFFESLANYDLFEGCKPSDLRDESHG